jgi:hypothetical protein
MTPCEFYRAVGWQFQVCVSGALEWRVVVWYTW